jgi:hypothetical protein
MNYKNKARGYICIKEDQINNGVRLKVIGTSYKTMWLGYLFINLVLINCIVGVANSGQPLSSLFEIDVSTTTQAVIVLRIGNDVEKEAIAKEMKLKSENYAPYAFFILSEYFYKQGRTEDAFFWYNAGILRCWYDANRSTYGGAKKEVDSIRNNVPPDLIAEQYADIAKLKRIVGRVIEWDAKTPYNYDPRWLYLYYMEDDSGDEIRHDPKTPSKKIAMNLPEEQWAKIAVDVRNHYWKLREKDMESYKTTNQKNKRP